MKHGVNQWLVMVSMLLAAGLASAADKVEIKVGESLSSVAEAWTVAPSQYTCTAEQRAKLEFEHLFCVNHTDHTAEYCYGTAFIRNCTKRNG